MLNLHRLLYKQTEPLCFHSELLPTIGQRTTLAEAKRDIDQHLRVTLAAASITALGMSRRVEPRCRTQGSWSYNICVIPAHMPPQEMDWDVGVYLPAIVWQGRHPAFAAKTYFTLVESSLQVLCDRKGWRLVTGAAQKDNCIRVKISECAHIDIPLYAAPESEFLRITELAKSAAMSSRARADSVGLFAQDAETVDWPWEQLKEIRLATRNGEWIVSDPFQVTRWFLDCVEEHGEQLRRVCRYLKAWRDYHWPSGGGPSSVVLMICACESFERQFHRDDVALHLAAQRMSTMLLEDIYVPAINGNNEENFNRLDVAERREAASRASELRWAIELSRGYAGSMKLQAVRKMQAVLGPRVPSDPDLVDDESPADRVRATAASVVAAPIVRNTRSG